MARVFTDKCIDLFRQGKLDPVDAAMAKLVTSELHCEAVDKCLQLFGGWGYMWEYPICRAYADARVVKIAGGSVEVMKTIIARDMFKGRLLGRSRAESAAREDDDWQRSQHRSSLRLSDPRRFAAASRRGRSRAEAARHDARAMVGAGVPLAARRHDPDGARGRTST